MKGADQCGLADKGGGRYTGIKMGKVCVCVRVCVWEKGGECGPAEKGFGIRGCRGRRGEAEAKACVRACERARGWVLVGVWEREREGG